GGHSANPTYETVCMGNTGHAETVLVEFDPQKVSFRDLLNVFWSTHDPTTANRQGPDVGEQYRSAIFFSSPEQEKEARESLKQADTSGKFKKPIVTQILPASTFYRAEDYHQQYLAKKGVKACH
ncbi:MAG: peptide-methionine (S)-S-oxide reductase MsrA, partial [Terriglobales bacterium]